MNKASWLTFVLIMKFSAMFLAAGWRPCSCFLKPFFDVPFQLVVFYFVFQALKCLLQRIIDWLWTCHRTHPPYNLQPQVFSFSSDEVSHYCRWWWWWWYSGYGSYQPLRLLAPWTHEWHETSQIWLDIMHQILIIQRVISVFVIPRQMHSLLYSYSFLWWLSFWASASCHLQYRRFTCLLMKADEQEITAINAKKNKTVVEKVLVGGKTFETFRLTWALPDVEDLHCNTLCCLWACLTKAMHQWKSWNNMLCKAPVTV